VEKAVALLRGAGILVEGDSKIPLKQVNVSLTGGPPESIQLVRCRLTFVVEARETESKPS
jgi:hypothetical protein